MSGAGSLYKDRTLRPSSPGRGRLFPVREPAEVCKAAVGVHVLGAEGDHRAGEGAAAAALLDVVVAQVVGGLHRPRREGRGRHRQVRMTGSIGEPGPAVHPLDLLQCGLPPQRAAPPRGQRPGAEVQDVPLRPGLHKAGVAAFLQRIVRVVPAGEQGPGGRGGRAASW